jgi:ABC-2 type transport system ATP-binding protein
VAAYLRFCCHMKRLDPGGAVDRAMGEAGVADLARRPVGRLSKGQRQRVGLAQAVLGRPPALVLDEPTAGLDPRQVVEARSLVRTAAADGAAVLVSTHLLAEAAAMCDRVVVIAKGEVRADEPVTAAADLEARFLRLVAEAELT